MDRFASEPGRRWRETACRKGASRVPLPLLATLTALLYFASAQSADLPPEAWPVGYSKVYRFQQGSVSQIVLDWEGLQARRFYLVLEAPIPFDASLVRVRDNSILYSERRSSRHAALIPWGRDEVASLSLKTRHRGALQLTMKIATDPAEEGLAIYSFHVNRYLQFYEQGDLKAAETSLTLAVEEDAADSMAAFLFERLWRSRGLTQEPSSIADEAQAQLQWNRIAEGQEITRLTGDVDHLLAIARDDSARALLGSIERFETSTGRSGWLRIRGRIELAEGSVMRSIFTFHDALDAAELTADRLEAYRMLLISNRTAGNDAQVEEIRRAALDEASDAQVRERIQAW